MRAPVPFSLVPPSTLFPHSPPRTLPNPACSLWVRSLPTRPRPSRFARWHGRSTADCLLRVTKLGVLHGHCRGPRAIESEQARPSPVTVRCGRQTSTAHYCVPCVNTTPRRRPPAARISDNITRHSHPARHSITRTPPPLCACEPALACASCGRHTMSPAPRCRQTSRACASPSCAASRRRRPPGERGKGEGGRTSRKTEGGVGGCVQCARISAFHSRVAPSRQGARGALLCYSRVSVARRDRGVPAQSSRAERSRDGCRGTRARVRALPLTLASASCETEGPCGKPTPSPLLAGGAAGRRKSTQHVMSSERPSFSIQSRYERAQIWRATARVVRSFAPVCEGDGCRRARICPHPNPHPARGN